MPKKAEKKATNAQQASARAAIEGNQAIAALVMAGADTWQKVIVYLFYGIILLTIVYLVSPPYATDKFKALLLVILLFVATSIFVILRYQELSRSKKGESLLPKTLRLPAVVLEQLRVILEQFRREAYAFLKTKNPDLADENVRANIFFPEYGKSQRWDDYVLKIRPGLHLGMEEPEIGIILQPGQGVTDKVFQTGDARTAKRLKSDSADSGDWDAVYHITEEVASVIHPDLKWIISMPIKGQTGPCIGVMNVDGLVHEFKTDHLFDCAKTLTTIPYTVFGLVTGI